MSTFNGHVEEFPYIRIDHFRLLPDVVAPLACFLSHVHSDHLVGLDSLRSPFVYCSPTTRELVLRLEKYPHRINFAKGILERRKQTYKHLRHILKPIPLDVSTRIELSPGKIIQVTLLDANHCPGAVMFLIQDHKTAILYTGDIRAEKWWVDSLCRHPSMVAFTSAASLRRLDAIYLDTTFAVRSSPYRDFPTKAEGLAELMRKLSPYPPQTVFYFHNWTFGYEDVLSLLSRELGSSVHVDDYRFSIYSSLSRNNGSGLECRESASLCGFQLGNSAQPGLFTRDQRVRLHSCEKGLDCPVLSLSYVGKVVHVIPIVSRWENNDIDELGAGGGMNDLSQIHELDMSDPKVVQQLRTFCESQMQNERINSKFNDMLEVMSAKQHKRFTLERNVGDFNGKDELFDQDDLPLRKAVTIISRLVARHGALVTPHISDSSTTHHAPEFEGILPLQIKFPYSRHSSYSELRYFLRCLQPTDIIPCTEPNLADWTEGHSMQSLFGDLYSTAQNGFRWDAAMRTATQDLRRSDNKNLSQATTEDDTDGEASQIEEDACQAYVEKAELSYPSIHRSTEITVDANESRAPQLSATRETRDIIIELSSEEDEWDDEGCKVKSSTRLIDRSNVIRNQFHVRKIAHEAAIKGKWDHTFLRSTKRARDSSESIEL